MDGSHGIFTDDLVNSSSKDDGEDGDGTEMSEGNDCSMRIDAAVAAKVRDKEVNSYKEAIIGMAFYKTIADAAVGVHNSYYHTLTMKSLD